jgi:hypothetical protein
VEIALLSAAVWLGVCPSEGAEAAKGNPAMSEFEFRYLFLIPLTLAEAFLLWALWQLQREIRKERKRQRQVPSSVESTVQKLFSKAI